MSNSHFKLVYIFSLLITAFILSATPVLCGPTIRVGVHESKPLAVNGSSGPPSGIYPEVIKEIARQAGWQIKWEKVTWLTGLEKIKTGELDILGPIAPTPEREKIYRFNKEPVIVDWGQIYLPEGSQVKSLLDLQNKKIAYQEGHIMFKALANLLVQFNIEYEGIPVKDQNAVFDMVARGNADAGAVNRLFGLLNEKRFQLNRSPIIYAPYPICFAASLSGDEEILETLDMYLSRMKKNKDSVYAHILDRHLFGIPEPGKHATIKQVLILIGIGCFVIGVMILWTISLRAKVNTRTRELAQSTEELKKANQLLNAVMENTTDAIFIKDLSGRYLLANTATCQALGKTVDEVIGRTDAQLFPESSAGVIRQADARVFKTSQTVLTEEKLETAYGETWWLANKSPYLDENDKNIGLIGISRDITDYKKSQLEKEKLQDQLRQAHKMEAIGTLAGGIAHDFNNILGIIIGNTELAMDDSEDKDPANSHLLKIKMASLRARDVVRQLLSFSRKTKKGKAPTQIQAILKECIQLLRASLPTTIDINLNISPNTLPIEADPTQIHQVIINLCTNAAQAMEDSGGILEITLENISGPLSSPAPDKSMGSKKIVRLIIQDSGCGIDPKLLERIFEPYFTTKKIGKGTGIGLSVVHGIVKSLDGDIFVESEPGKGTCVTVTFPASEKKEPLPDTANKDVFTGTESILLVDDEPALLKMGASLLERFGYQVTGDTDPLKALALFSQNPDHYDLIITDLTMPGLTGDKLVEKCRKVRADIPIIICTGFSSRIHENRVGNVRVDNALEKPFDKLTLSRVVRQTLDNRIKE